MRRRSVRVDEFPLSFDDFAHGAVLERHGVRRVLDAQHERVQVFLGRVGRSADMPPRTTKAGPAL